MLCDHEIDNQFSASELMYLRIALRAGFTSVGEYCVDAVTDRVLDERLGGLKSK